MNDSVKVSYVVASYNHEAYIAELLQSILDQTYHDFEVIIVDDGSRDDTVKVAEEVAALDSRIRVFTQQNQGVVAARNRGIGMARGEYVSIVDSDDILPLERTAWMVGALDSHPAASMVYGDAWIVDSKGKRLGKFFENYPPPAGDFSVELFSTYCFVSAVTVMFRRSLFDRSGPLWGPGANTDYLKWIELGLLGEVICLRDKQLGCWRWHGANESQGSGAHRAELYAKMQAGLEELARRHPELAKGIGEKRLRWRYGRCHFMGAFYAGLLGSWSEAQMQFAKAIKHDPSLLNRAAWYSTLPVIRWMSAPLYRIAERMALRVRS